MRKPRCVLALVAVFYLVAVFAADAPREVGCIKTYGGQPKDYELRRGTGETQPVQPLLPLFEGDQIIVKAGAPPIVLSLSGKNIEREEIVCDVLSGRKDHRGCTAASPFRVTGASPVAGPSNPGVWEFVVSLGKWLAREQERQGQITRAELRDSEISVALLDMDNARMLEGTRTFVLTWRGCNPSTFWLSRRGQPGEAPEVVFTAASSLDGENYSFVRREHLHLRRGNYQVRIVCDLNKESHYEKPLFVVGVEEMPASPDFAGGILPRDLERVAHAGWLAENADASWRLEAFEELADLPNDLAPAKVLRNALAGGHYPRRM